MGQAAVDVARYRSGLRRVLGKHDQDRGSPKPPTTPRRAKVLRGETVALMSRSWADALELAGVSQRRWATLLGLSPSTVRPWLDPACSALPDVNLSVIAERTPGVFAAWLAVQTEAIAAADYRSLHERWVEVSATMAALTGSRSVVRAIVEDNASPEVAREIRRLCSAAIVALVRLREGV